MTTATLDCYLTDAEHSISRQFSQAFQKQQALGGRLPYLVIVSVRYANESYREVFRAPLQSLDVAQIPNLVNAIREAIHKRFGHSPEGLQVRTRGYAKGQSADPDIDCKRTLSFVQQNEALHPHVALLEQHNTRLVNLHATTMQEMSATMAAQGTTIAAMAEAQASLATARTAATSSSDVASGGINGLLALGAMAGLWPIFRDVAGLPKDLTFQHMLKLAKHRVEAVITTEPGAPTQIAATEEPLLIGPPPTIPGDEEEELQVGRQSKQAPQDVGQVEPPGTEADPDKALFTKVLARAKERPDLLRELAQAALSDPKLKQALLRAYLDSQ